MALTWTGPSDCVTALTAQLADPEGFVVAVPGPSPPAPHPPPPSPPPLSAAAASPSPSPPAGSRQFPE